MTGSRAGPRSKRAREQEILRLAVEDTSRFIFTADEIPVPASAGPSPPQQSPKTQPGAPAAEKPHHLDHRTRLRDRFARAGGEGMDDCELLELLLFRVTPRRDTKPLAKALLSHFGDLAGVLSAEQDAIARVKGAGKTVAQSLKVTHAVLARAQCADINRRPVIGSWSALVSYCRTTMAHATRESFRVLFLDAKNTLLADEALGEGARDHAPIYPREVARRALQLGAASAILVHTDPSGDPRPSPADIAITREVMAAAKAVGMKIHDHIIVGREGVSSLRNLQLM